VKIGKVQSARRRYRRDVKENEREAGGGQKGDCCALRIAREKERKRERGEGEQE